MRYVAAYLLATLGGNASPSADDVKAILSSVGIDADAAKLDKVFFSLKRS
jgi:large subunit ribosomal protein LP2